MVIPMNNILYLFVGKSSSGKTTIANMLEPYGYNQVWSYCTRKPRYENEPGHTFISEEAFDNLGELAAYTEYDGHRYATTIKQLESCNLYVIDVPGVKTLLEKNIKRPIVILYFDTSVYTRIQRMQERNDSSDAIISRLLQDEKDDWFHDLDHLVWHYRNNMAQNVHLYSINANGNKSDVFEQVVRRINIMEG